MALVTVLTLLMSIPAGYALARIRPIASGTIFLALLSAMFIPPEATIIPLFQYAAALGWVDTHYPRSEEHTSELQSRGHLVCRLLLEKKNKKAQQDSTKAQ